VGIQGEDDLLRRLDFHKQTFKTGPLPLTPGAQYILFASLDKDYEKCSDSGYAEMGPGGRQRLSGRDIRLSEQWR